MILGVLAMAGCTKDQGTTEFEFDKSMIYKEEIFDLNLREGFNIYEAGISGDRIYLLGNVYDTSISNDFKLTYYWYTANLDGTDLKEHVLDIPENVWVEKLALAENGKVYVFYPVYEDTYYDEPEVEEYSTPYYGRIIDESGNDTLVDLTEFYGSWASVLYVGNNQFIMSSDGETILFDEDLNYVRRTSSDEEYYNNLISLRDGTYAVSRWDENGELSYAKFDTNTLKAGEKIEVPFDPWRYNVIEAKGKYDMYLSDGKYLYGWNIGDPEITPIVNFLNSDIYNNYYDRLQQLDDQTIIASYYDWYSNDASPFKIAKLTKVAPEDVKDKKNITLGCLYLDSNIHKSIIDFNKSNDEYRIAIVDYSQYYTDEDWDAGTRKFNQDIASGNAPDVIISNSLSVHNYMEKGLFLDLTDRLKNDPDIDYDDIFPNLIEATSYKGKVYMISPWFSMQTVTGKKSVLGDRTGWTIDEMLEFKDSLPAGEELFALQDRYSLLYGVLGSNYDEFIGTGNGKCNFDSEEFIKILEFVKTVPTSEDLQSLYSSEDFWMTYDLMWRDDKTALNETYLYSAESYQRLLRGTFMEDVAFVGYPSSDRSGAGLYIDQLFAINSKTKDADAAWDVVKCLYSSMDQVSGPYYGLGFPASMKEFDEMCADRMKEHKETDEYGYTYNYDTIYIGNEELVMKPLTQDEIDKLKDYILSVDKLIYTDDEIINIVMEEADPFFAGQKTAEEVAGIIQSRVSIYINEKK